MKQSTTNMAKYRREVFANTLVRHDVDKRPHIVGGGVLFHPKIKGKRTKMFYTQEQIDQWMQECYS